MSKKYLPEASSTIITNDLYLAAFLHCVGCTLDHVQKNDRRRLSFVFIGERVQELREAYCTGPVRLDLRSFRESLFYIRRLMDSEHCRTVDGNCFDKTQQPPEQRSVYAQQERSSAISLQPAA